MSLAAHPTLHEAAKWQTTIGKLCDEFGGDVQTGPFGSQLHASDYSQEGTPIAMPRDLIRGRIVCDQIARVGNEHVQRLGRHCLEVGDIVFSRRGDITRFAVVTEDEVGWLCGTGCIRIRLNCPDVDVGYLRRYLEQESIGKWLLHEAKGITMPNLNTKIVRALPFVYPPLAEQKRIAGILDAADALRAKRREALAQLDTLLQSTFLDMFGDPVTNPMGWALSTLGEHLDLKNGVNFSAAQKGSGVLTIDVKNMYGGAVVDTSSLYRVDLKPNDAQILKDHDILFVRSSVKREGVGWACTFREQDEPVTYCGFIIRGRLAANSFESLFLVYFFRQPQIRSKVISSSGQVAITNISQANLARLSIPIPPLDLQRRFAAFVESVERQKARMRAHLTELDALFASLQSRAFNGEL